MFYDNNSIELPIFFLVSIAKNRQREREKAGKIVNKSTKKPN